ncbi:probable inactive protein kinase DDB_G0270444 isoform X3 [Trachinotus anak]|uniref:probable inactive protein kinase DDB_G0270444 isoform X3 n=1 Tax=Trachinotus anak TaxID=443729 RepID=UPI0039F1B6D1
MKILVLLSLSLAVAHAMPPFPPGVVQSPDLIKEDQSPLLGDLVPVQGHVEVEDPAPQPRPDSTEQQEKLSPVSVDMKQSSVGEAEAKAEPEVKVEQEPKAEVKVEQELKEEPEVKVEQELKAEPEVKVEQELKEEPEVKVEEELKEEPEVKVEQELKEEPEVKVEQELKEEPEVKVEQELKEEPEVKVEEELKEEPEVKVEQELKEEPEVKVEQELKAQPDVKVEEELKEEPEVKVEPELKDDPEFQVEPEAEVEPDVQMELEAEENPMFNEVQEEFQVQLNLEAETETGREIEERHIDMEGNNEIVGDPIMELVPLDDDNSFGEEKSDEELSEMEKTLRAAFNSEDPDVELLPEDEGLKRKREVIPDGAVMEEGPALDINEQQISTFDYFPNEEARMGKEQDSLTAESDYSMMEEPRSEFVGERDLPSLDGGAEIGVVPESEEQALMRQGGRSYSPFVAIEGKRYHFFKGPRRAEDAEFFCQAQFPGGHLASITTPYIHREVMNMIVQHSGVYTRTWIGGLRYLETGRFVWLDGSRWGYADWLSGEPNNTADVEDCVELLASRNGKFNDFTCWEPQAFICSYPYQ